MAEILPFRAWRYNSALLEKVRHLTSPLFDVVSIEQRAALYSEPLNSIHLSLPLGKNPAEAALKTLIEWKKNGTIMQDALPGIYVYYQYFNLPGIDKQFCRKGFICNIKAYDWNEMVILRHENTIPSSVNDRMELLAKTEIQVSPTHGLYSDPTFDLEKYMDESMLNPLVEAEDYQGVIDKMSVIQDQKIIQKFIDKIKHEKIILADGHHRYESSLAHKHDMKSKNPDHTGKEAYNYHFMYLTNSASDDIVILPTHRLVIGILDFDEYDFIEKLKEYFHIQPADRNISRMQQHIKGSKWMFGILLKNFSLLIRLREEVFDQLTWSFSERVKALDLTVLHFFIIEKVLKIYGKDQRKSEQLRFERDADKCRIEIEADNAQVAIIVNPVSMQEVKEVCYSGYTLPQKSTYFYPKVISGFLFNSIKADEFTRPDPCI